MLDKPAVVSMVRVCGPFLVRVRGAPDDAIRWSPIVACQPRSGVRVRGARPFPQTPFLTVHPEIGDVPCVTN